MRNYQVVRTQAVTTDLAKEGHAQHADETATGGVGAPEFTIIIPGLIRCICTDLRDHLLQLKLDNRVVDRTLAMVLGKDSRGFFVFVVRHEPSRGFGDEEDSNANDTRGNPVEKCVSAWKIITRRIFIR